MTILLALASSMLWGTADFLGGTAARRLPALQVVLFSQAAGLLVAILLATVTRSFGAPLGYLPWAMGAGAVGAAALVLFYRALAVGTMGVVSPVAAVGVVVPVAIGLVTGTLPSGLAVAGIVVAMIGVVAISGPERGAAGGRGRSVLMALGAAAGFGLALYGISGGARTSAPMTMVAMRATSVPLLAVALLWARRGPDSPGSGFTLPLAGLVAVTGTFDVSANLMFGLATRGGSLAVVAVLGSLYPGATVLLARIVHGERLSRWQQVGALTTLAGVAMIATGS